jgi:type IV secretory pathway TraG/TraD family ATPase VirD4
MREYVNDDALFGDMQIRFVAADVLVLKVITPAFAPTRSGKAVGLVIPTLALVKKNVGRGYS